MGFGPVGTIRKQVMKQMRANKSTTSGTFKISTPSVKVPKSTSFKTPKSKIKFQLLTAMLCMEVYYVRQKRYG